MQFANAKKIHTPWSESNLRFQKLSQGLDVVSPQASLQLAILTCDFTQGTLSEATMGCTILEQRCNLQVLA